MKTFTLEQADEDFLAVLKAAASEADGLVEITGDEGTLCVKCTTGSSGERPAEQSAPDDLDDLDD